MASMDDFTKWKFPALSFKEFIAKLFSKDFALGYVAGFGIATAFLAYIYYVEGDPRSGPFLAESARMTTAGIAIYAFAVWRERKQRR
jgi:hypothetical protein